MHRIRRAVRKHLSGYARTRGGKQREDVDLSDDKNLCACYAVVQGAFRLKPRVVISVQIEGPRTLHIRSTRTGWVAVRWTEETGGANGRPYEVAASQVDSTSGKSAGRYLYAEELRFS